MRIKHILDGVVARNLIFFFLFASFESFAAQQNKPKSVIKIEDSRGIQVFHSRPKRIVVLTWSLVESLMELGVTPIAVADIQGYNEWVSKPALPDTVLDIGSRQEPNLELLAQIKPDLILLADQQIDLADEVNKVAPVLAFKAFDKHHDNVLASREIFLKIGYLLGKKALAEIKLHEVDQKIATLKDQLKVHFKGQLPKVTSVRFNNASVVWVYGKNSMPEFALKQLGFSPAMDLPATQWGVVQKRVRDLGSIQQGIVLHFEPFNESDRLFNSRLWKAMPFIQQQQFASVEPRWTYGGPKSIQYLAEAMTVALMRIEPKTP